MIYGKISQTHTSNVNIDDIIKYSIIQLQTYSWRLTSIHETCNQRMDMHKYLSEQVIC